MKKPSPLCFKTYSWACHDCMSSRSVVQAYEKSLGWGEGFLKPSAFDYPNILVFALISPSSDPVKRTSPASRAHSISSECLSQSAAMADTWWKCELHLVAWWSFDCGNIKVLTHFIWHLDLGLNCLEMKRKHPKEVISYKSRSLRLIFIFDPGSSAEKGKCTQDGETGREPGMCFPQNLQTLHFSSASWAF